MRRLLSHRLVRAGVGTYAVSVLVMAITLMSGVLTARVLGAHGRGEYAAITTSAQILGWLFEGGCAQAVSYHEARHPDDGPALFATWSLLLAVLTLLGIAVGEAILPALFAAQNHQTLITARIYMASIGLVLWSGLINGAQLGGDDLWGFNTVRLVQPTGITVVYVCLWQLHELSVTTALAGLFGVAFITLAWATVRVIRRAGLARPRMDLARSTFWYAFKGHGTTVAGLVNARLDLLIMPAFLGARSIGLYSVATTVTWLIYQVSQQFAQVLMPVAARRGDQGVRTIVVATQVTAVTAGLMGIALAVLANVAIEIVYGPSFSGAVPALRLLIPGSVLFAVAGIPTAGLYALNRPGTATISQLLGMVITVAGLLVFLRTGGIMAAAIVSTASYAVVFIVALVAYKRSANLDWTTLVPSHTDLRRLLHSGSASATGIRLHAVPPRLQVRDPESEPDGPAN